MTRSILTDGSGRPFDRPEPPGPDATADERIADCANNAFVRSFRDAIERDRAEVERRGYPDSVDYEALILAEAEPD